MLNSFIKLSNNDFFVSAGFKIPKDTLVAINHWALHHDPDAWKDVETFKPERYLDENGKLGPKPQNWLPFSAGKRVCLGEFVAKPELHLLFAGLMQRFSWSAEEGVFVDITPQGSMFEAHPLPFNVLVKPRQLSNS